MADGTKIEWTEATWNPITGCSLASPGCMNCYAMQLAGTRLAHHPSRAGLTRESAGRPKWTGEVRFNEQWLADPLKWKRPRMIFVCAHGDLFHESVPDEWIDRVFAVMALSPRHTFQVLTKRSARMRKYVAARTADRTKVMVAAAQVVDELLMIDEFSSWPLPNVWLGVSVEDQQRADQRIPDLLATPAAVRWLSCEPLLGAVDLEPWLEWPDGGCELPDGRYFGCAGCDAEGPFCKCPRERAHFDVTEGPRDVKGCPEWVHAERITLDWIVCGGESGPGARPMHPDWAQSLRDQCAAAGVPFFFKQWGNWLAVDHLNSDGEGLPSRWLDDRTLVANVGKKAAGRLLDGVEHNGMPEFRHLLELELVHG